MGSIPDWVKPVTYKIATFPIYPDTQHLQSPCNAIVSLKCCWAASTINFNGRRMGCVCILIATWTDRKVMHMHTTMVMQWSCKCISISGDAQLELYWFDWIRECCRHTNANTYTLKRRGFNPLKPRLLKRRGIKGLMMMMSSVILIKILTVIITLTM